MSSSIKFILFMVLFTLGFSNAEGIWIKNPQVDFNLPRAVLSVPAEPAHASFNIGKETNCPHIPYYGESGEDSAFDVSNAILFQCGVFSGLSIPKILKNNSTIRCLRNIEPGISVTRLLTNDPDNSATNLSYRYYVYTLRHIII